MKVDSAEFIRSAHSREGFLRDGRNEVAFVGRSNVGKSSLMNRLLGRKGLARVGSTPGRTRSINYFLINRRFYFVDLPGYGYARAGKEDRRRWAELVEAYLVHAGPRLTVVQLIDGKVGATELDMQAYEYLHRFTEGITVVATKIDRVPRSRRRRALAQVARDLELPEGSEPLPVSARTGEGVSKLWGKISAVH